MRRVRRTVGELPPRIRIIGSQVLWRNLSDGGASPLAEDDADGGLVEDCKFERAPGFLVDDLAIGVEHGGAARFNLIVEGLNVVGFDGDLGAIFGSVFRTGDNVGLCPVALNYGEIVVPIANLESETTDEEIEALF